jgi:hypothetical protein
MRNCHLHFLFALSRYTPRKRERDICGRISSLVGLEPAISDSAMESDALPLEHCFSQVVPKRYSNKHDNSCKMLAALILIFLCIFFSGDGTQRSF